MLANPGMARVPFPPPPPTAEELQGQRWKHEGGAHPALWRYAPPLADVRARLAALLRGRVLVGHHLAKDLAALALQHPQQDQRDTLRYRQLQGRRGAGRRLKRLSAEKLGREIQRGRRHSPRCAPQGTVLSWPETRCLARKLVHACRWCCCDDLPRCCQPQGGRSGGDGPVLAVRSL